MWERIQRIDARVIYFLLLVAITIAFFIQIDVPVEVLSLTRDAYNLIESLEDGAKVLVSHDYSFGTQPEIDPIIIAFYKHLAKKNAKIYAVSSVVDGPMLAVNTLKTYESLGKTYGVDYVNLGYFAGGEAGLAALAKDMRSVFKTDFYGTPLSQLKMMDGVNSINDFDLVISGNAGPADGANIDAWVRQIAVPYRSKLITAITAIMVPRNMPFVQAGQITASVGGLRGGAEYERLIGSAGPATLSMNAQSSSQFLLLILVILGNVGYWVSLKKGTAKGGASNGR